MNEFKGTPGEWEAKQNSDSPLNRWRVVGGLVEVLGVPMTVVVAEVNTHGEETEPNARLMAASKSLLAELAETVAWLDGIAREADAVGPLRKGGEAEARRSALVAKLRGRAGLIRQVILKATQGA